MQKIEAKKWEKEDAETDYSAKDFIYKLLESMYEMKTSGQQFWKDCIFGRIDSFLTYVNTWDNTQMYGLDDSAKMDEKIDKFISDYKNSYSVGQNVYKLLFNNEGLEDNLEAVRNQVIAKIIEEANKLGKSSPLYVVSNEEAKQKKRREALEAILKEIEARIQVVYQQEGDEPKWMKQDDDYTYSYDKDTKRYIIRNLTQDVECITNISEEMIGKNTNPLRDGLLFIKQTLTLDKFATQFVNALKDFHQIDVTKSTSSAANLVDIWDLSLNRNKEAREMIVFNYVNRIIITARKKTKCFDDAISKLSPAQSKK